MRATLLGIFDRADRLGKPHIFLCNGEWHYVAACPVAISRALLAAPRNRGAYSWVEARNA